MLKPINTSGSRSIAAGGAVVVGRRTGGPPRPQPSPPYYDLPALVLPQKRGLLPPLPRPVGGGVEAREGRGQARGQGVERRGGELAGKWEARMMLNDAPIPCASRTVEVCVQSIPSAWGSCSGTAMAAMLWQLRRLTDPDQSVQCPPILQLAHGTKPPFLRPIAAGPCCCFAETRLAQTGQHPIPGMSSGSRSGSVAEVLVCLLDPSRKVLRVY